jgi:hypothetical protein
VKKPIFTTFLFIVLFQSSMFAFIIGPEKKELSDLRETTKEQAKNIKFLKTTNETLKTQLNNCQKNFETVQNELDRYKKTCGSLDDKSQPVELNNASWTISNQVYIQAGDCWQILFATQGKIINPYGESIKVDLYLELYDDNDYRLSVFKAETLIINAKSSAGFNTTFGTGFGLDGQCIRQNQQAKWSYGKLVLYLNDTNVAEADKRPITH